MNETDLECRKIVNELAAELLGLTPSELLARQPYGSVDREVKGKTMPIGFWHYEVDGEYHIHFKLTRRLFWFFYRSYVSGIVFSQESRPRLMTDEEAANYD